MKLKNDEIVLRGRISKVDAEWAGGAVTCNVSQAENVTPRWILSFLPTLGLPVGTEVEVVVRLSQTKAAQPEPESVSEAAAETEVPNVH